MNAADAVTVVVVDDEDLVREGLAAIIGSNPEFKVVAMAADGAQAIEAVRRTSPDVVLMDVRMPGIDGIEATKRIVASGASSRVLMLTTMETDETVAAALSAGATGFLLKSVPREQLWWGIRAAATGDALLAPTITRRLIEQYVAGVARPDAPTLSITDRQRDVVKLVARGESNAEIAASLFLAEATVKSHISDVLTRHGLRDRTQLVVLAYESGLVRPGDVTQG
ncbi:response regulator transcription factor [Nocardioides bizhenqiangii]|uniref:Response regulator transcription factor n=1 Tax=Nocardioides bizhenqiangii TaxID=3095076 RepID=A0ABZ0ZRC8_9ACTN|nr:MULTISPECIES: response regulator transcription factor [unclassified Nocardioides]MDZ5619565.1 response regulator transcription factor [Nocardioides sp. HM23]WQQ26419.1 response regulator transcription factor [Nocardioides sp. HM61]